MSTSGNLVGLCTGLLAAASMALWLDNYQAFLGGVIGVCSYVILSEFIVLFRGTRD